MKRVTSVLRMLGRRLERHEFLIGSQLTAADIYWATFANLIIPLPEEQMPTLPMIRKAYECRDPQVLEAITPRLAEHQRRIYEEYLELPVQL
jgi:glutathione S-transferase